MIAKWDALYAEALRSMCERSFPTSATTVCQRAEEALGKLRAGGTDLLLLGLTFPDRDGLDVLEIVGREGWARRVVVVSGRKDEHTLRALRVARMDACFDPLSDTIDNLAEALRLVASGGAFISESLRAQLIGPAPAGTLEQWLTVAELQVFCVIGDGTDDLEASDRLGLSQATVQTHRRNIMRKLAVSTSAKLVREAVRFGVVRIASDGTVIRPGFEKLLAEWRARKSVQGHARPRPLRSCTP